MNQQLRYNYERYVYKDINIDNAKQLSKLFLNEVTNENYKVVENIIELGIDINCTDKHNANALHYAAYNNKPNAIDYLIKNKINTKQLNSAGQNPLFSAVINNASAAFDKLSPMYDINIKDTKGYAVIHYAIANENADLVSKIFKMNNFNFNTVDKDHASLLHYATLNVDTKIAQLILDHVDLLESKNKDNMTPLLSGCKVGNLKLVPFLLRKNADVHAKDINENTILTIAAQSGHKEIVEFLLDNGVAIDLHNNKEVKSVTQVLFGEPLLNLTESVSKSNLNAVKFFLNSKINPNNKDNLSSLLPQSVKNNNLDITKVLLSYCGSKLDNDSLSSLLMQSVKNNNLDITKVLLNNGVDINEVDKNGTLLTTALKKKNIDIATLLIQHNAATNLDTEIMSAVNGISDILNIIVSKKKNKIFTTTVDKINLNDTSDDTLLTINNIEKDVSKDILGVTIEYSATNRIDNWESKIDYVTQILKIDLTKTNIELFSNIVDNKYGIRFYSSSPESKLVSTLKISGEKPKFITAIEDNHASILLFEHIPGIELEEWTRNQKLIEDILQRPVEIEECDDTHELYNEDFNVNTFIMLKETAISIMPNALGISGQYRKSAINDGYQEYYFKNVTNPEKWIENKDKIIDYINKRVSIIENGTNIILRETIEETIPKLLNLEDSHKNYPKLYAVKEDGQNKTYYYTFLPEIDLNTWKQNSRRISFRTLFNEPNKVYKLETYEKLNSKIYDEDFYKGQLIALHEFAEIPTADDLIAKNTDLTKEFKENKIFWGYQAGAKAYYTDINALSHMMIIGGSGSGKSNLMNGVILSLLNSADKIKKIYLLDLKEGCPEFGMYRNLESDKITVFSDQTSPIAVRDALYEIEAEMIVRSHYIADQGGKIKKMTYDPIYIIIDEYSQIELMHAEGSEENNAKNQINDILLRIGSKARSANIKLIVQTQDPTFVGNDLKRHLQSRVLLKTFNQSDAVATMIMPDFLEEQGLNHIAFSAGRFVFEDNNENNTIQTELQFPFVDPEKEQYLNYKTKAQTNTSTDDSIFDKYKEGAVQKAKYLAHTELLSGFVKKLNQDDQSVKNGNLDELEGLYDDTDDALTALNSDLDELTALYGELED